MIEVVVSRIGMDPSNQTYVVVLQEKDGRRLLPIWIGQPEAESIVVQMQNMKRARPLTHDLCKTIIAGLGATLRRVQITHVESNTYFGELHLVRDGQLVTVDSRPSDAIAIALRLDAPLFAAESLLVDPDAESEEQGADTLDAPEIGPIASDASGLSADELKEYLEHLRPEDFGKFKL